MKKLCLLIIACLFLLVGCNTYSDPLAYQKGGISCEIDFSLEGRDYGALVTLSPIYEDGRRDAELVFTAPENIRGVSVMHQSSGAYIVLDDLKIPLPGASLSGFFEITDAFSIGGNIEKIDAGEGVNVVRVFDGAGRYIVYLDTETHTPTRIDIESATRNLELHIKNFTNK